MLAGLRALIWKTHTERQLDEELRSYLEMATDRRLASGMPRPAAARAARAEMGGVEAIKDLCARTSFHHSGLRGRLA